uniref:Leucine rich immune protein (Coil-less) n=1 Tax=Anopheles quadriannulatus TaxID=34691 RepID=A0A904A442_ANOQN
MGLLESSLLIKNSPLRSIQVSQSSQSIPLKLLVLEQSNLTEITFEANDTQLETLIISNSLLQDIPSTVAHLVAVEQIAVRHSPIQTVDLSRFGGLQRLESIDLSSNVIERLRYTLVSDEDFPSVKAFYMTENQLTVVNFNYFSRMKQLQSLSLCNNRIHRVDGWLDSSSLNYLDLSQNAISAFSCCSWNASGVVTLALDNNTLEQLPSCLEQAMSEVKYITLSHNALVDGGSVWSRLATIPTLQMLNLDANRLTSAILNSTFPSLIQLSLQHNRIKQLRIPYASHGLSVSVRCNLIDQFKAQDVSPNVTHLDMGCNPMDVLYDCNRYEWNQPNGDGKRECIKRVNTEMCEECFIQK